MEKSFDFGRLLKNHEQKHKKKPAQFTSVAGGVQKRLGDNLKHRKSSRLTVFDRIRNLPRCESPTPVVDTKSKVEHRRQQLEKWKEEKEKRKKQAAAQKKKPFVAGVPHAPLKFVPPPPPPKPMPALSGRVTRSQSAKQNAGSQKNSTKQTNNRAHSFAPMNATFQPPKNLTKVPLAPVTKNKKDKISYTFNPVLPMNNTEKPTKTSRSRTQVNTKQTAMKSIVETRTTRSNAIIDTKNTKITKKPSPKGKIILNNLQSSSSSEIDTASSLEKSPVLKVRTPCKFVHSSKQVTPKNRVPKSESSSEEKLRSPKSPIDVVEIPMTPEQAEEESKNISPCVTMSRGKDNARREMKKKMEEGLLDDDTSDMENINHFRRQLQSEIKRMTEMCEVWDKVQEHTPLSESIQELVLGAVGQARLLMSQKLQQFASLVERCARPEPGQALVTPADLQGFWDMVFMQVENIDMRFKKLEELRARGWEEDAPAVAPRKPLPKNNAKKPAKPSGGPSRLREMIAAARKAKKEQEEATPVTVAAPAEDSKTFEAGFFCVKSPVRSPAPATPNAKHNLLKAVLSSEAKKASATKNTASFAMLRASILSKNVEDGIAPLPLSPMTPINLYATPARSILKSTNVASFKKSGKKSIKVVLFDEADAEHDQSRTEEEQITLVNGLMDLHTDSGMSSMDVEKEAEQKENKENTRRRCRLVRQDAVTVDRNQVTTRSQRKSLNHLDVSNDPAEEKTPRRSSRKKKALQESENIIEDRTATPKRSVRSRKSGIQSVMA